MNKSRFFIALFFTIGIVFSNFSQKILLSKAKVHVGTGKVINQGLVGIEGDKIIMVENALTYTFSTSDWDTIIDCSGQELYPGFFALNSRLGLSEIDAVRATRDFNEIGDYNPNIRSLISFNTDSDVIATTKANGILVIQSTPQGGVISGSSSILKSEAWNWEDAAIKSDDGIHLHWPKSMVGGGWWASPAPIKGNSKYRGEVNKIRDFFKAATAYDKKQYEFDPRFEAMKELFSGKKRLYIHANYLLEIMDIIEFKNEFKIKYPVIVGGYDAYKVASHLKSAEIPIVLRGNHALPLNEDDPTDLPYRLPHLLQEAGILFSIQNSGSMDLINERNLPFIAGSAMSYGLSEEEAVAMLTLNAAKITGVEQNLGSIEKGKKATLFVSKGNALDMKSHHVTLGMIDGRFINLRNIQTDLDEKFRKKYGMD